MYVFHKKGAVGGRRTGRSLCICNKEELLRGGGVCVRKRIIEINSSCAATYETLRLVRLGQWVANAVIEASVNSLQPLPRQRHVSA